MSMEGLNVRVYTVYTRVCKKYYLVNPFSEEKEENRETPLTVARIRKRYLSKASQVL